MYYTFSVCKMHRSTAYCGCSIMPFAPHVDVIHPRRIFITALDMEVSYLITDIMALQPTGTRHLIVVL